MTNNTTDLPALPSDLLSVYPPSIVLLTSNIIDTCCGFLGCVEWRDSRLVSNLPIPSEWLQYHVPSLNTILPELTKYSDYWESETPVGTSFFSPKSMYQYAFETPTTALSIVTSNDSMIVLMGLVLLLRLIKSFALPYFQNIGREAGRSTHGSEWERSNEIRITKFGEYVFRLIYHFMITIYGTIFCVWKQSWWYNTKLLFVGFPYHEIEPTLSWYYLFNAAYNIDALMSLLELSFIIQFQRPYQKLSNGRYFFQLPMTIQWSSTVRGDFREMMIHHIVTNLLIFGSSHFRFPRIGSMVFWVHDISDIPVDLSKLANFLKWKQTTTYCFLSMCCLWLCFRLIVLPFHIYRAVLYEAYLIMIPYGGNVEPILYATYKTMFVVLIGSIILLHVLWFTMMIRMGYLLWNKGEAHDLTEHKKGEKQLEEEEGEHSSITTTSTTTSTMNGEQQQQTMNVIATTTAIKVNGKKNK